MVAVQLVSCGSHLVQLDEPATHLYLDTSMHASVQSSYVLQPVSPGVH